MQKTSSYRVEYGAYINAIHRCHNPKHPQYRDYGGRGIYVCDEWRAPGGFWLFLDEIGRKPSPELTLDRLDNNKGYEPGNVGWRSRAEQARNRRNSNRIQAPVLITIGGVTQSLKDWSLQTGLNDTTIRSRYYAGYRETDLIVPAGGHGFGCASKKHLARKGDK